jgi:cyclic beta-1,2-glucan synthetase
MQGFLRRLRRSIARRLNDVYRDLPGRAGPQHSRAEAVLIRERRFVRWESQALSKDLSRAFCRKLVSPDSGGVCEEPRIHRAIQDTVGSLLETAFGSQGLEKVLTTGALAELLDPERVGAHLTVAEVWAIPTMVKLVVFERLARCLSRISDPDPRFQQEICGAIDCLRALARIRWSALLESISSVHHILSEDPSLVYPKMEFESRDLYRGAVEDLAKESKQSEEAVAKLAITLARESGESKESDARRSHVGYYLIGAGVPELRRRGKFPNSGRVRLRDLVQQAPSVPYVGGIAMLTAALTFALYRVLSPIPLWWIPIFALPLSQIAVWVVNFIVTHSVRAKVLPRIDFSKGIPYEHRTLVVVPTLLLSRPMVKRLLERVEVHYLANRDSNLLFALLTDFPDSKTPRAADDALLAYCVRGIRRLNARYASEGRSPFFLLHRLQRWNPRQDMWMGFERKRGKLEELNRFLLGLDDTFTVKAGDLPALRAIRYVLTVDTDTLLPRDTARKLVSMMAHPMQSPVIDPVTRTVREGCGILAPCVSTSMESAGRSRLTQILSGQTGVDSYATAVSDVYQDVFGQANFTGKGLYDVRALHAVLDGRFPYDAILSHDLIEGEHARTGLVTDACVVEDFPSTYEAFCQRRHRWVRGDWQLLWWILPWVPREDGRWIPNPLSAISRWKLIDNLRRSLFEIGLFLMITVSWVLAPAAAVGISLSALGILGFSVFADALAGLVRLPALRFWPGHFRERWTELARSAAAAFLAVTFLPHQAVLMADAMARSLVRRFITKRNLLEWVSMAQTESGSGSAFRSHGARVLLIGLSMAAIVTCLTEHWLAFTLCALWLSAPAVGRFVNAAPRRPIPEPPSEVEFLRDISLRTWRYFIDFSRSSNHWLVPDNVQEQPEAIAHRASPTNIGLQLASNVAACDFGYITRPEFAVRLENLLDTIRRMDRYRGHLWNWYDTETLQPALPRYVSTVDSGNLAAALITVKQACEEVRRRPIVDLSVVDGIRDHCVQLRQALPAATRQLSTIRALEGLIWKIEAHSGNLFAWRDVLAEASELVEKLNSRVAPIEAHLNNLEPEKARELRYWRTALDERVRTARGTLIQFAPWLEESFRQELAERAYQPRFEELMEALSHVPRMGDLAGLYGAIDVAVVQLLDSDLSLPRQTAGLLALLKEQIGAASERTRSLLETFAGQARATSALFEEMDFAFLFDTEREQMHVGYNAETGALDNSYYDLLASEARTAVFLAVAKGDAPCRTWFRLGRKSTSFQGHLTLLSWSGTMFEYLMPALFMRTYEPTLLGRSLTGAIHVQQAYAKTLQIPWGISESSCLSRDQHSVYRAFGVPAVSMSQTEEPSVVVAPYASMLALMFDRQPATENLRWMASQGWTGRYGFFDAVDYEPSVSTTKKAATVVRSFMAHHQGMGLLALCNALFENSMQNRFHAEPMVAATEILLQERVSPMFVMADG